MGTTYSVRAFPEEGSPKLENLEGRLRERVESELARIDALMSSWREDSEVSRFNAWHSSEPFEISGETAGLLERGREISRLTGGAFDPALGQLVRIWGFGPWPAAGAPSEEQVEEALAATGFERLVLDGRLLRKKAPELWLDLGGIAPGYAVDRVFDAVRGEGFSSVLVEIGGEVRAGSPPPGRKSWKIGIEKPNYDGSQSLYATLELMDMAVSTSGDYRKWIVENGRRLSHILDPRTGRPADSSVVSATVVAADCATADALATALVVLGPEEGVRLIESLPDAACLLLVDGKHGLEEKQSSGMDSYLRRVVEPLGRRP